MTSHQPTILIIGGPDKANCYSEGDITRVAHHPLDVLRLRHLYDYDAVIIWPSTLSPADWTFNLTKGELRKEFANYFASRSPKEANNNECGPSATDKTPHSGRKQTRKMSLKPKDFISNNLSLVIDYYINSTDKPSTSLMAAVLGYPRLLYVLVPTWLIQDMLRPSSLFKKSSQNNDDSHILVDDDDKKQILKWYDKKLYDIVCGVANRQLAFYIAPNIENSGQNIEILNWIHFPVKVESDPVIKFYFSQPPEPSKHSILSILSELGSIIKEWKYVFIPPQNSSFSLENLIFWYGRPLHKKLSIGTYHTDGEGRPRSLMILSEKAD